MTSRCLAALCLLLPLSSMAADPDEFAVPTAAPVSEVDLLSVPVDDRAPVDAPLAVPAQEASGDVAASAPLAVPVAQGPAQTTSTVSYPAPVDSKSVRLQSPPAPVVVPLAPVEPVAATAQVELTESVGPVKKTTRWIGRAADNTWQATRKGWTGAREKLSGDRRDPSVDEVADYEVQANELTVDVEVAASVEPPAAHGSSSQRPLAIPGNAPVAYDEPAPVEPVEPVARSEYFAPQVVEPAEKQRRKAGLYVGVTQATTTLAGVRSRDFGVEGGLHLYRRLLLGGALHGVQNLDGTTAFAYGGFQPGITWKADRRLHLRTDMLWGLGFVQDRGYVVPVNVIMPRVAAELSLGRVIKLDVHAAYRKVPGNQPKAAELTGWQVGVGARLGTF